MNKKTIHIPLINFHINYYFDGVKFSKEVLKEYDENMDMAGKVGMCYGNFIWIKDHKDKSTIMHETLHAIDNILYDLDSYASKELRAYMFEYCYNKIEGWFKK